MTRTTCFIDYATLLYIHRSIMLVGTLKCDCALAGAEDYPFPK